MSGSPNLKASGFTEISTVKEYLVTATDGLIDLTAQGENSSVHLNGESVCMDTPGSSVKVINSDDGVDNSGGVDISASGAKALISLETPSAEKCSQINISPDGILLAYGLPTSPATIALTPNGLTLSVGLPVVGAMIEMKADSIVLKVGATQIALTDKGIVSKALKIESEVLEEISESVVGGVKRTVNPEGHFMVAALSELKVEVDGIKSNAPIISSKADAAYEITATLLKLNANALASLKGALTDHNQ